MVRQGQVFDIAITVATAALVGGVLGHCPQSIVPETRNILQQWLSYLERG